MNVYKCQGYGNNNEFLASNNNNVYSFRFNEIESVRKIGRKILSQDRITVESVEHRKQLVRIIHELNHAIDEEFKRFNPVYKIGIIIHDLLNPCKISDKSIEQKIYYNDEDPEKIVGLLQEKIVGSQRSPFEEFLNFSKKLRTKFGYEDRQFSVLVTNNEYSISYKNIPVFSGDLSQIPESFIRKRYEYIRFKVDLSGDGGNFTKYFRNRYQHPTDFINAEIISLGKLPNESLKKLNLDGAKFVNNIYGLDFSGMKLNDICFGMNCKELTHVNFSGCTLNGIDFNEVCLNNVDFRSARFDVLKSEDVSKCLFNSSTEVITYEKTLEFLNYSPHLNNNRSILKTIETVKDQEVKIILMRKALSYVSSLAWSGSYPFNSDCVKHILEVLFKDRAYLNDRAIRSFLLNFKTYSGGHILKKLSDIVLNRIEYLNCSFEKPEQDEVDYFFFFFDILFSKKSKRQRFLKTHSHFINQLIIFGRHLETGHPFKKKIEDLEKEYLALPSVARFIVQAKEKEIWMGNEEYDGEVSKIFDHLSCSVEKLYNLGFITLNEYTEYHLKLDNRNKNFVLQQSDTLYRRVESAIGTPTYIDAYEIEHPGTGLWAEKGLLHCLSEIRSQYEEKWGLDTCTEAEFKRRLNELDIEDQLNKMVVQLYPDAWTRNLLHNLLKNRLIPSIHSITTR